MHLSVREGQGAQLETWLEEGSVDLVLLFRHSPTPKPAILTWPRRLRIWWARRAIRCWRS
ncbi:MULTISPECIES: hypothetical protein [Ralstonia solanacearum species complex]|uniref:hypothetical protein n=1 Tax=Ralstonia solanacearum species complex TaxID=3116862 RepID=UPI001FED2DBC|nr:hypothetical protein [Ralstonia solanacearum]